MLTFLLIGLGGVLFITIATRGAARAGRSSIADRLGLLYAGGGRQAGRISGLLEGHAVSVEFVPARGDREARTEIRIEGVDRGICIRSRYLMGTEHTPPGPISTGDVSFDETIVVWGQPEAQIRSILDGRARRLLMALLGNARVENGEVALDSQGTDHGPAAMERVLRDLTDVAHVLVPPEDVEKRLTAIAASDDPPAVRLACLQALLRSGARPQAALRNALGDDDAAIQALAADALGTLGLSDAASDSKLHSHARANALRKLARVDPDGLLAVARLNFSPGAAAPPLPDEVAAAGAEALGETRLEATIPFLAHLASHPEPLVLQAAAAALGRIGGEASETLLVALLAHREASVRHPSIVALGAIGTVRSVEPLLDVSKGAGLLDSKERRAADQALAQIRTRITGAEPGQLSMVQLPRGGELTVAPGPGSISLLGKDEGPSKE